MLLQKENSRLKQLEAELSLDETMLQDVLRKCGKNRRGSGRRSTISASSSGLANGMPDEFYVLPGVHIVTRVTRMSGRNWVRIRETAQSRVGHEETGRTGRTLEKCTLELRDRRSKPLSFTQKAF